MSIEKYLTIPMMLPLAAITLNAKNNKPMNILLILADDLGYECIGANGSTYQTDFIDELARQGVRFENCHSQPLSTPSRVELMTGKYNDQNYKNFAYLDPSERTFAHMAKEQGYATCIAGKWQLGYDKRTPEIFGFDEYCLWQLTKTRKEGERYANVLYEKEGKIMPRDINEYGPDIFVRYLEDFIVAHKDQPFFAYYPMALTHDPFYPTPDSDVWDEHPELREKQDVKYMKDMVKYVDKNVRRLVNVLDREGLRENTIVIFVGDNGTSGKIFTPMKDGSVIQGGKGKVSQFGTHVPMIVNCPAKIRGNRVNTNMVDFTDFYITFRDIIGGDKSKDKNLDGISFLPQLLDKKGPVREVSFCHYQYKGKPDYIRFAQTVDYKLFIDGRFYNTRKDPFEEKPIPESQLTKAEKKIHSKLQAKLDSRPLWGAGVLCKTKK